MCTGTATVSEFKPRVDVMRAAPDDEVHLASSANFTCCGRFRAASVTTDARLITCHSCQLALIPARSVA